MEIQRIDDKIGDFSDFFLEFFYWTNFESILGNLKFNGF